MLVGVPISFIFLIRKLCFMIGRPVLLLPVIFCGDSGAHRGTNAASKNGTIAAVMGF
jgi:hypothetical protein